jgi:predicted RNase H-like HicB family nuclease
MDTYAVIVHEAEEGGYWAEVPALPGCHTQGETLDELRDNVVEAIQICLAAKLEDEGSGPTEQTFTWTISVPRGPDLIPA